MSLVLPLLPILLLIAAAFAFLFLPPSAHVRLALLWATHVLAGLLILQEARGTTESVWLLAPSAAVPTVTLALNWAQALPLAWLLLPVVLGRLTLSSEEDTREFVFATLIVEAGALGFLAADSWMSVAAAWLMVEFGLFALPLDGAYDARAGRAFAWNLAALVAWLTAGLLLTNEGAGVLLNQVAPAGAAAFLASVAVWVRAGLWPFYAAVPFEPRAFVIRCGVPLLLGGTLLARLVSLTSDVGLLSSDLVVLALVGVGASALMTLRREAGIKILDWVWRSMAAPLMAIPFAIEAGAASALGLWLTLSVFGVTAVLGLVVLWRSQTKRQPWLTFLWASAIALGASLPLSPGFWGRVGLLSDAFARRQVWLLLLWVTAATPALIPLWRELFHSRVIETQTLGKMKYAALVLTLVPFILSALLPTFFLAPLGPRAQQGVTVVLDVALTQASTISLVLLGGAMLIPIVLSYVLARSGRIEHASGLFLPEPVVAVLELRRLARSFGALWQVARALVQQTLGLVEQPPLPWLIFLALWVALWMIGLSR